MQHAQIPADNPSDNPPHSLITKRRLVMLAVLIAELCSLKVFLDAKPWQWAELPVEAGQGNPPLTAGLPAPVETPLQEETGAPAGPGLVNAPTVYQMGQSVLVGDCLCVVGEALWSGGAGEHSQPPEAAGTVQLTLLVAVRNHADQAVPLPVFTLVDEQGREYQPSTGSPGIAVAVHPPENLAPGGQQDGLMVFDLPAGGSYRVKVQGRSQPPQERMIEIRPTQSASSQGGGGGPTAPGNPSP